MLSHNIHDLKIDLIRENSFDFKGINYNTIVGYRPSEAYLQKLEEMNILRAEMKASRKIKAVIVSHYQVTLDYYRDKIEQFYGRLNFSDSIIMDIARSIKAIMKEEGKRFSELLDSIAAYIGHHIQLTYGSRILSPIKIQKAWKLVQQQADPSLIIQLL